MKRLLFLMCLPVHAMQLTSSLTPKEAMAPQEIATALSLKLFDRKDEEVVSAFTRIITRDLKGNVSLLELRYKMISQLEAERLACEHAH